MRPTLGITTMARWHVIGERRVMPLKHRWMAIRSPLAKISTARVVRGTSTTERRSGEAVGNAVK
jgi:hypothetical protein